MKLVSFLNSNNEERLGLFVKDKTVDLSKAARVLELELPSTMNVFLQGGEAMMLEAKKVHDAYVEEKLNKFESSDTIKPLAPVPHPTSCRDAYAFRQHVAAARRNRGVDMIAEFDQFPIFYFTNHNAIIGEGDLLIEEDHLEKLDFELESAIVIGKRGKNIKAEDADQYIAGFTIMNDFSARRLQMEEMKLNLGPAKGKDFATAIGPWLVTLDELEKFRIKTEHGDQYNLAMKAHHNGKLVSEGNTKNMTWTYAEIIERCSYGVDLFPGDVIGSGTVGTGCYLELNGTWKRESEERGESFSPVWLQVGDKIDLEIECLGQLSHTIVKPSIRYSILARKKNV